MNYTFRRTLTEKVQQQWIADTPEHFRFVLKANQYITHIRRLKDTEESVERFFSSIGLLASSGKLAPVLFQLPPNLKADVPRLREFLDSLPPGAQTAWEFRHESWFNEETYEVLSDYDSALCLAENETMTTPPGDDRRLRLLSLSQSELHAGATEGDCRPIESSGRESRGVRLLQTRRRSKSATGRRTC